jgi:hypothetical protein
MTAGILCPECGAKSEVKETRPHAKGNRRRRYCLQGHRFFTLETVTKKAAPRPKAAPKAKPIKPMDLPLTYLTIAQKARAKKFFEAGWKVSEVAPMFDMTAEELRK